MVKLPEGTAKKVDSHKVYGGAAPEGIYLAELTSVKYQKSASGNAMWVWSFTTVEPLPGKSLVEYVLLEEKWHWKMKQMFHAFGVDATHDTDELVGRQIKVEVIHEVQVKKGRVYRTARIGGFPDENTPLGLAPAAAPAPAESKAPATPPKPSFDDEDPPF